MPALARSTRSAFLARCHPKIEVSAEQQIRHKTYENSYIMSIISLLWKKIKLTNRKGRMELKRGVGFLPIASVSSYRPLPLLVFFFYPALQPSEISSEMSCVYMESGAEPLERQGPYLCIMCTLLAILMCLVSSANPFQIKWLLSDIFWHPVNRSTFSLCDSVTLWLEPQLKAERQTHCV